MTDNQNLQNRFLRQLEIVPPEKLAFPITVIGAGAIGSATVVTLAKMGCSDITVWDADTLEDVNIPNQLCKPAMISRPKVEALAELVDELTEVRIKQINRRYMGQRLKGVVIVTVDNMTTRQKVWKRAKLNRKISLLIDARMGAEFARIYAIYPTNIRDADFYEQNLYSNEDAEHLPCSARSIIYCPTVIAGYIALLVKQHAVGQPIPREVLIDLPNLLLQA
ncbi:MAG: ThiF family adenylyltransferase [Deltaproteobacteria bacterium]|nr:ThiF family adenylyltransferase [Deltaproteobacteria bacterium]